MRISDWSSDVCSSDLGQGVGSSFAHIARRGMLLARTDVHVPNHRGLTYFLLDLRAPGVRVEPLRQMPDDAHSNEVWLEEVRVSDADRVGEVGRRWSVERTSLFKAQNPPGDGASEARRGAVGAR